MGKIAKKSANKSEPINNPLEQLTFADRDEFNRKPLALELIGLLQRNNGNYFPLLIDGKWGIGKSEFSYKLVNEINHNKYKTVNNQPIQAIYFNAFEYDYANQPLIALLSKVIDQLSNSEKNELKGKLISMGTSITSATLVGLNIAASLVNIDMIDSVEKAGKIKAEFDKKLLNSSQELNKQIIEQQLEYSQNMERLKSLLVKASENLSLCIVVDELDRCRPDYALAIIENIKHVFELTNINFILVTNKEQLHNIIKHRYGTDIDATTYLDKFIKLEAKLPMIRDEGNKNNNIIYIETYKPDLHEIILYKKFDSHLFAEIGIRDTQKLLRYWDLIEGESEFDFLIVYWYLFAKVKSYSYTALWDWIMEKQLLTVRRDQEPEMMDEADYQKYKLDVKELKSEQSEQSEQSGQLEQLKKQRRLTFIDHHMKTHEIRPQIIKIQSKIGEIESKNREYNEYLQYKKRYNSIYQKLKIFN